MKRLLAILLILATPAWAANDEKPVPAVPFDVCVQVGTPSAICAMRYSPEVQALDVARLCLERCPATTTDAGCLLVRAYIKQRWGY
jgi:hypothetical protein